MRRRFVIGIDALDEEQEKKFREYIASKGAWWHWISNMWLMTTKNEDISAAQIRDQIKGLSPKARVVVFEFPEDITWATSGNKNAQGKKLADWLKTPWGDDDEE
jgi:hypothetical protein